MTQDDLEDIERSLTQALSTWAIASTTVGTALTAIGRRGGREQLMRFGRQSAMWGAIDGLIAGAGALSRKRRGALSPAQVDAKANSLRRLLVVNAVADVGYVAGGLVILARGSGGRTTFRMGAGDGLAIVIQGGFLLVLDAVHARRLG